MTDERKCEWCQATLEGRRADARYCSGNCRQQAHHERKTAEAIHDFLRKRREDQ